jgi:hypothetical protein
MSSHAPRPGRQPWSGVFILHPLSVRPRPVRGGAFCCARYCCFDAEGGFAAGVVVSPGVVFLGLVLALVFDFVFVFGVVDSAAGA